MSSLPTWLTVADVAEVAQTSTRTVRRMVARGELKAHRFGERSIRFKAADVERAMRPVKTYTPSAKAGEELD